MANRVKQLTNNGHNSSPFAGVLDPITQNAYRQLVANLASMHVRALERGASGSDPRRDLFRECGYPEVLTIEDYWRMYDRNPVARRVNNVLPRECWKVFPELRESEDGSTETDLEREFQGLDGQLQGEGSWYESRDGKTSIFFDICRRADEACGIGPFGVTLVGLDDGVKDEGGYRTLREPVQGFYEDNSVPVKDRKDVGRNWERTPGRWTLNVDEKQTKNRKLLYLRPFDASVVNITQFENNPSSRRCGQPVMYSIRVNAADQVGSLGLDTGTWDVHWTRVVHHLDGPENSHVFGTSRLHAPFNQLANIATILGADGEGYWKNAFAKIFLETHPQLGGDVNINMDDLRAMFEEGENSLQNWYALMGMSAKTLPPQLTDPTPHIKANIDAICLQKECPVPVFLGYEIGEQASTENRVIWNGRVAGRQNGHCTVRIAVPIIDRLIAVGVLPKPKKRYTLVWPDLESMSEKDAALVANMWADFMTKYIAGGLENLMAPDDAFTRLMRMSEEEAVAVLSNTLNWVEFTKWVKARSEAVELEPVEEWPGEVPTGGSEDNLVAVGHLQEGDAASLGAEGGMGPGGMDPDGNPLDEDGKVVEEEVGDAPPQFDGEGETEKETT